MSYICEICDNKTYEMLRLPQLQALAGRLGLPLISIADLQRYRYWRETLVAPADAAKTPAKGDGGGVVSASDASDDGDRDSNSPGAGGSTSASTEGWAAAGGDGSAPSTLARHRLRSIYNDNEYEVAVISSRASAVSAATDGGAAATASVAAGSTGSIGLAVQFDALVAPASVKGVAAADVAWQAALRSAAASGLDTVLCVRVYGDVRENVKGKEDAGVGGRHAHGAAAPVAAAGDAAVSSPTALRRQPSAYDAALTLPPCLHATFAPSTAASSSVQLAARAAVTASYADVCDRVSAEAAQAVRIALAAPAVDDATAAALPSVTLLLQPGASQPLPRVWEYGVAVTGVQAL